jgi:hypothetical protein
VNCPSVPELLPEHIEILGTIQRGKGDLALLSVRRQADLEPVVLLCRVWKDDADKEFKIRALAEIINGDPTALYYEPDDEPEVYQVR